MENVEFWTLVHKISASNGSRRAISASVGLLVSVLCSDDQFHDEYALA